MPCQNLPVSLRDRDHRDRDRLRDHRRRRANDGRNADHHDRTVLEPGVTGARISHTHATRSSLTDFTIHSFIAAGWNRKSHVYPFEAKPFEKAILITGITDISA